jgi:predicted TIM-barrel fold metal-dependent hydrolase
MRNGYKVYDADTHVRPSAEAIRPYLTKKVIDAIPDLEESREVVLVGMAGEKREPPYHHRYRFGKKEGWSKSPPRHLGEAGPRQNAKREFQTFMGTHFPTEGGGDHDSAARLKDMDEEGTDVHFIVHTGGSGHPNPELELEFVYAQHRYLNDFCGRDPHRLKSCITITPDSVEGSIAEIKKWGKMPWAVAVHPKLPIDYPLDHPDLNPIWEVAQDHGLAVIHHSLSTGYPGYRDMWANPFLGRCGSHPWAAMRAMSAFFGAGLMDRYPKIRYGVLESGFGWLPFWTKRMDDQVIYLGYVNEDLKRKMSEYTTDGRFFIAIEQHEGPEMAKMFNNFLGDHLLMFGSDYPHAESRFPESADKVLAWENIVGREAMQKMMWDNAVRFFGEP